MATATDFSKLSRKEQLDKRLELVAKARAMVSRAEQEGRPQLSGEDQSAWEQYDVDIDSLGKLLDTPPQQKYLEKLAQWDKSLDSNPGTIIPPPEPGSGQSGSLGSGTSTMLWRGEELALDGEHMQRLQTLNSPEYDRNFKRFLRAQKEERLGMKIGEDAKGGVLASVNWVSQMIKFLDDAVFMRKLATVIPTGSAEGLGAISWDTDPADADWTPEVPASAITEDDTARMGKREMLPHKVSKLVKISNKLRLHHPMLMSFLIGRLGYKFAVTEEKAYMTGSGAQQPLGVFTANDAGIPTSRDIETGSSLTITFDDFINAFYSVKAGYLSRSSWIVSRQVLKTARKLKDTTNQYLWEPSPRDGTPSTILGRPYNTSEFCPGQTAASWTAGVYVAAIGAWDMYWIADCLMQRIKILEELFSLYDQVGVLMFKETDGQPVLAEAFARIALKA